MSAVSIWGFPLLWQWAKHSKRQIFSNFFRFPTHKKNHLPCGVWPQFQNQRNLWFSIKWCPGRDLNSYGGYPHAPQTCASADSATRALIEKVFTLSYPKKIIKPQWAVVKLIVGLNRHHVPCRVCPTAYSRTRVLYSLSAARSHHHIGDTSFQYPACLFRKGLQNHDYISCT